MAATKQRATAETKQERFRRIAPRRVEKAIKAIDTLAKCADKSRYEADPREVVACIGALGDALDALEKRFEAPANNKRVPFSLPAVGAAAAPPGNGVGNGLGSELPS